MTALAVAHEALGCYLVFTLGATGLAKMRLWRRTSIGMTIENVIPGSLVVVATVTLSAVELSLAILLASGQIPQTAGLATALLFLGFAGYKVAVAVRTGKVSCSCSGTSISYKATRPTVAATIVASLTQASLVGVWVSTAPGADGMLAFAPVVALVVPVAACLKGFSVGTTEPVETLSTTTPGPSGKTFTERIRLMSG